MTWKQKHSCNTGELHTIIFRPEPKKQSEWEDFGPWYLQFLDEKAKQERLRGECEAVQTLTGGREEQHPCMIFTAQKTVCECHVIQLLHKFPWSRQWEFYSLNGWTNIFLKQQKHLVCTAYLSGHLGKCWDKVRRGPLGEFFLLVNTPTETPTLSVPEPAARWSRSTSTACWSLTGERNTHKNKSMVWRRDVKTLLKNKQHECKELRPLRTSNQFDVD